jgi:hypothetical protein
VQLADSLAVGLRPVVQGVAAVPVLFRRASQVDEDPDRGVNLWIDFMKSTRRLMAARPYGESRGNHHAYVRDKDLDFPNGLVVAAKGTSSPSERDGEVAVVVGDTRRGDGSRAIAG